MELNHSKADRKLRTKNRTNIARTSTCTLIGKVRRYRTHIRRATKTRDPGPGIGRDWPWHIVVFLSRSLILSPASGYKQKRRDVYCYNLSYRLDSKDWPFKNDSYFGAVHADWTCTRELANPSSVLLLKIQVNRTLFYNSWCNIFLYNTM